jgi:hypothetical protein
LIIDLIEEKTLIEILIYQQTIFLPYMLEKEFQHQEKPKNYFFMSKDEGKKIFPSKGGERFSKVGFKKSKMNIFF